MGMLSLKKLEMYLKFRWIGSLIPCAVCATDYGRPVRKLPSLHGRKSNPQSQIFRYGRSIFCLPHRPKISYFFDLCFHWVSVVRVPANASAAKATCSFTTEVKLLWFITLYFWGVKLGYIMLEIECIDARVDLVISRHFVISTDTPANAPAAEA